MGNDTALLPKIKAAVFSRMSPAPSVAIKGISTVASPLKRRAGRMPIRSISKATRTVTTMAASRPAIGPKPSEIAPDQHERRDHAEIGMGHVEDSHDPEDPS